MSAIREWWRRCKAHQLGPFMTDFRCLLPRKHDGPHYYDPDRWMEAQQ